MRVETKWRVRNPGEAILLLVCHETDDYNYFGPGFGLLLLNRDKIEELLRLACIFRVTHKMSPRKLHQMTYKDLEHMPQISESYRPKTGAYETFETEDEKLEAFLDNDENAPYEDGCREVMPGEEIPEEGNRDFPGCTLVVTGSIAQDRVGMVDFYWTNGYLETCKLKEETVRALLGKLS